MATRNKPGAVRDAIISLMEKRCGSDLSVAEIVEDVTKELGREVPASSVRSYLNLNTPRLFTRTNRGRYTLTVRR